MSYQPQGYHHPSSIEEVRTLWIGDLQYWVDEAYLNHCFVHTGRGSFHKDYTEQDHRTNRGRWVCFTCSSRKDSADLQWDSNARNGTNFHKIEGIWFCSIWDQDLPGSWGPQIDPSQWSAYYGYGQGYEAFAYGALHDPSAYVYGAYAGYAQYPQQVEGAQDMAAMAMHPKREELYDPLAMPEVDKLNGAFLSVLGTAMLGRSLWQKISPFLQQA